MQLSFRKPGIMAVLAVICIFTLSALFVMNTKYMHKMFNLDANINIAMIATSEIRTSCVVSADNGVKALRAVHATFKLGCEI